MLRKGILDQGKHLKFINNNKKNNHYNFNSKNKQYESSDKTI